jgi:hypothetical protein
VAGGSVGAVVVRAEVVGAGIVSAGVVSAKVVVVVDNELALRGALDEIQ